MSDVAGAWGRRRSADRECGHGIKIAIIDSGIDQTHLRFRMLRSSCRPASRMRHSSALRLHEQGNRRAQLCAGRAAGSNPEDPAADSRPTIIRARSGGHGSAVASVAAGVATTVNGTIVPALRHKLSWVLPDLWRAGSGQFAVDQELIQALDDAVTDGMAS